ncbi:MAG TPA: hypothetical protein DIC52_06100 [Candidatus Latescibacteria bacterium]|nr:hypothetical protein [Candidatus Latescibacterota bacterium]
MFRAHAVCMALAAVRAVLQESSTFAPQDLDRIFRLSMSDYSEMILLPPLVETLHQQAPGVQIEVLSTAAFQPRVGERISRTNAQGSTPSGANVVSPIRCVP